ncbi:MAG TPA: alpha/beta hydrolase [Bradyrhizobium sp.]
MLRFSIEMKNTLGRLNWPRMLTVSFGCRREGFRNAFSHYATAEQIALSAAVQRPIALKCIQEPVPPPAWRSKPSWYLIAEEDRMINPKTQHFMAQRMGATTRSLAVDHTPLLSAPLKVVDIILEAKHAVSF